MSAIVVGILLLEEYVAGEMLLYGKEVVGRQACWKQGMVEGRRRWWTLWHDNGGKLYSEKKEAQQTRQCR